MDERTQVTSPRAIGAWRWLVTWSAARVGLATLALALPAALASCATAPSGAATRRLAAYLTTQVDYPQAMLAGETASLTLTLTPHGKLAGAAAENAPSALLVALPADLSSYADILLTADAQGAEDSPVAWQLTNGYRQSLLSATSAERRYAPVTFRWQLTGLNAGRNVERIVLGVVYVYRDGTEHAGSIEVTPQPVPITVRASTLLTVYGSPLRIPLILAATLLGVLALLWFAWGVVRALAAAAARKAAEDAFPGPPALPQQRQRPLGAVPAAQRSPRMLPGGDPHPRR